MADIQELTDGRSDGSRMGKSASEKNAFFGATPVVQPSGAAQGALTDSSTGTANTATGIAALTGTYNSTILANAIATLAAAVNAQRSALVSLGLIKGGA